MIMYCTSLDTSRMNTFVTAFQVMYPAVGLLYHSNMFGLMAKKTSPGQQTHTCPMVNN